MLQWWKSESSQDASSGPIILLILLQEWNTSALTRQTLILWTPLNKLDSHLTPGRSCDLTVQKHLHTSRSDVSIKIVRFYPLPACYACHSSQHLIFPSRHSSEYCSSTMLLNLGDWTRASVSMSQAWQDMEICTRWTFKDSCVPHWSHWWYSKASHEPFNKIE